MAQDVNCLTLGMGRSYLATESTHNINTIMQYSDPHCTVNTAQKWTNLGWEFATLFNQVVVSCVTQGGGHLGTKAMKMSKFNKKIVNRLK